MARIFVSHSSKDSFEALAFRQWLVSEGWSLEDVFIDLHGIGAGERWRDALKRANERCEAVVLLASPASLASTECQIEVRMAEDFGKEVIVAIAHNLSVEDDRLDGPGDLPVVHDYRDVLAAVLRRHGSVPAKVFPAHTHEPMDV